MTFLCFCCPGYGSGKFNFIRRKSPGIPMQRPARYADFLWQSIPAFPVPGILHRSIKMVIADNNTGCFMNWRTIKGVAWARVAEFTQPAKWGLNDIQIIILVICYSVRLCPAIRMRIFKKGIKLRKAERDICSPGCYEANGYISDSAGSVLLLKIQLKEIIKVIQVWAVKYKSCSEVIALYGLSSH